MSAGDGKPEIHPSLPNKDMVESLGTSPNMATAEKLLSDAEGPKLSTGSTSRPLTANTFGMVSLTSSDKLINTGVEHKAVKTGMGGVADFAVNFVDGGVRNLANIGDQTIRSIKDPLSTFHDVGTAVKTIAENPTVVKNMASDFGSSLIGDKGAGEAGSSWGNLTTTVGIFFVGGKHAVQRTEQRAVETAASMEQKIAQTSKILSSAEASTVKADAIATRIGTGNAAKEIGQVSRTLPNRIDGLKVPKPSMVLEPVPAPKLEPLKVSPKAVEPLKVPKAVEPVVPKAAEPVVPKTEPLPKLNEPVIPREPIAPKTEVFKPAAEPVAPKTEVFKPGQAQKGPKSEVFKPGGEPQAKPRRIEEPALKPKAEEPALKPKAEEPALKPKAEEPALKPKAEEPALKPKTEEPVAKPKAEEPAAKPKTEEPAAKPKTEEPAAKPKTEEPAAKPKTEEPAAKPKTEEPAAKPKTEEPAAKPKTEEPAAKPKTEEPAVKPKTEEPAVKPKTEEPAVKPKTEEPGKPGDLDRNLNPKEPGKPGTQENFVNPSKEPVKPVEPIKPGKPGEPIKPGEPNPIKPGEPIKPGKPGEPNPNILDNNVKTPELNPANPRNVIKPNNVEPALPDTFTPKVKPIEPVAPGPRPVTPIEPVAPGPRPVSPAEPLPRPFEPSVKPADISKPIAVDTPALPRNLTPKDAPLVVAPSETPQIRNLTKELDKVPANVPGANDAQNKLRVFNEHPSLDNYRNLSDSLQTLSANKVIAHEQVQVALEAARQSVVASAVANSTSSLEGLLASARTQVAGLPAEVQGKAQSLLQEMRAASSSLMSAEFASGQKLAVEQLKTNTSELIGLLQKGGTAHAEIESSLLKLSNAQRELIAANYLVRTGDSLGGKTADFLKTYWSNILGGLAVGLEARSLLGTTAQRMEAELKKLEESQPAEKTGEAGVEAQRQSAEETRSQQSLFLNSKEPLGKAPHENEAKEAIRKQNLSMYGIDGLDFVYYQKGFGQILALEDARPQSQQNNNKAGFRGNTSEQQDKTSAPSFDYTKTRMPASRASGDSAYLSSPMSFRPGSKYGQGGRGGAAAAAANDPNHANSLMSKNYAFVVGPGANARYGGPAAGSEAAEKQNPDRGAGGGSRSSNAPAVVAVAAASAQNDPPQAGQKAAGTQTGTES